MTHAAYALPEPPARTRPERFGEAVLEVADLDPAELAAIVAALERPGGTAEERARAVERAARRFADPRDALRVEVAEIVGATTGASPAMVAEALGAIFAPLEAAALAAAVSAPSAPLVRRVAIVAAGNVPGVAVAKTALALVAGVATLVKPATAEPFVSVGFARALIEECPALAAAHAVVWWRGGRAELESAAFAAVDALVAYGSDETIAELERSRPRIFVGHGHRVSVAAIRLDGEVPIEEVAGAAARDVALHDQQGCLSPQVIFAIGGDRERLAELTRALAAALERLSEHLPRAQADDRLHVAIRRFREAYEWRALRGEPVELLHDARGTEWTVVLDPEPRLPANPLHRTIVVRPLASAGELAETLAPLRSRLESLGIAPAVDGELTGIACSLGIPRIVPIGTMQTPGLDWRQGGRDPLAGLLDECADC
jgi:acyl-CoA reductase-like NAD-dependent aldehyde dehydrogenase